MRLFLFAFLCLASFFSGAQTAIIRHNVVILENEELFKIYSTGTFSHQTYKIKSIQEEDLILVDQTALRNDQGTLLMKFIFITMPNAEAYIPVNINFKKHLARLLVNYNVIKNNTLNEKGVNLLCKNYSISNYPSKYISTEVVGTKERNQTNGERETQHSEHAVQGEAVDVKEKKQTNRERDRETRQKAQAEQVEAVTAKEKRKAIRERDRENSREIETVKEQIIENTEEATDIVIAEVSEEVKPEEALDANGNVKRDISQLIYLSGSKIRQDSREIGSYQSEKKMLLGQEGKQITFYALNGDKLAIARFIDGDEQCELMTVNDRKTWNIPIPKGDIYTIVKDIVKVLADRMYM